MKIAFFINGPDEHGLVRASRILADALARVDGCSVRVVRSIDPVVDAKSMSAFRRSLNEADVVVIHASSRTNDLWGTRTDRPRAVAEFCSGIGKPVVMHLHDVYGETAFASLVDSARGCVATIHDFRRFCAHGSKFLAGLVGHAPTVESQLVRAADSCVAGFLVSNEIERKRMQRHRPRHIVEVVPHFIERRSALIGKADAKKRLGVSDRLVVTLLGFIVKRKGHDVALSMLQTLPANALLVFAGSPSNDNDSFYQDLLRTIEATGCRDRVRITGYLEDRALDVYLSATDVAICPFQDVSASGSFATWLAAGKPIVASDLPLFRMYRSEFGDGIKLARRGDAASFARLVGAVKADAEAYEAEIRSAADRYSVENMAARMLGCLQRAVDAHSSRLPNPLVKNAVSLGEANQPQAGGRTPR